MCEKTHDGNYGSGRFCESKCARKFSTFNKRKLINKKVSEKLKRPSRNKYCKSCCEISNTSYCSDCKKWSRFQVLFSKLNINDTNLQIASQSALKILYLEYFENRLSKPQILEKYRIMSNTMFNFFKRHGISLRSISESLQNAVLCGKIEFRGKDGCFKSGWYSDWSGVDHYYRSSYELNYYKILDSKKIEYQTEKVRIKYYNSQENRTRIAVVDIYTPNNNTLIEIKSDYTYNYFEMQDRVNEYKNLGYNFMLVLEGEEYRSELPKLNTKYNINQRIISNQ